MIALGMLAAGAVASYGVYSRRSTNNSSEEASTTSSLPPLDLPDLTTSSHSLPSPSSPSPTPPPVEGSEEDDILTRTIEEALLECDQEQYAEEDNIEVPSSMEAGSPLSSSARRSRAAAALLSRRRKQRLHERSRRFLDSHSRRAAVAC